MKNAFACRSVLGGDDVVFYFPKHAGALAVLDLRVAHGLGVQTQDFTAFCVQIQLVTQSVGTKADIVKSAVQGTVYPEHLFTVKARFR